MSNIVENTGSVALIVSEPGADVMSRVIVPITGSKDSSHYTIDEGANIGIPNEIATQIVKFLTDQGFLIEVVKPRQKVQDGAKSTNYTPKNASRS
jgi:hypothetical protein